MDRFEYDIISLRENGPGTSWWFSNANQKFVGDPQQGLIALLNSAGEKGWEVAGIGNLGEGPSNEIVLKRRVVSR